MTFTYDALGRFVERNKSGTINQVVYAPTGAKLAYMQGQSFAEAFIPLPGNATALYTVTGLYYRHPDWLGSARITSTPQRGVVSSTAYAPFGETYASTGGGDVNFTGQESPNGPGLYDFPAREYSNQGRWASPDPAGLAAVDPANPQSWNRYAYVTNNPLGLVDPLGLDPLPCDTLTCIIIFGPGTGPAGAGGARGGADSGGNPPCTVQAVPDPYTELVLAGYGLPEDLMEMAPPPQQTRPCGNGGASNTGGGNSGNTSGSPSAKACVDPRLIFVADPFDIGPKLLEAQQVLAQFAKTTIGIGLGAGAAAGLATTFGPSIGGGVSVSGTVQSDRNGNSALVLSFTPLVAGLHSNIPGGGYAANVGLQFAVSSKPLQPGATISGSFSGSYGFIGVDANSSGGSITIGPGTGARFGVSGGGTVSVTTPICKSQSPIA